MALFDFLKRKKDIEKSREDRGVKKAVDKNKKVLPEKTPTPPQVNAASEKKRPKNVKGVSYDVIREPHISEKATVLAERNAYLFKVVKGANKPEIKKAVEAIYGVDVLSVNVLKIPKKKRRLGRTEGFRKGFVKAVVTVREGQTIEV